jgi:DNA-binding transcriptional LysR family regulator
MIRIDDLQVFVHAAQSGSFSAAARQLDLSPALASTAVQRLEQALSVRLFVRSTRRMRLSDEGVRYLPHARSILGAIALGREELDQGRTEIAGPLRLSVPSDLGRNVLLTWLDAFQQEHPRLSLNLHMSDQTANFFQDQLDAGVRYGRLSDSSLVALPLVPDNRRTLCAAPAYIARHGAPRSPQELSRHNCLCYVMGEQTHDRWTFHLPTGISTVTIHGDRVSDDADVVRRWAVAGLGIIYKSRLDVWPDLVSGRLLELIPPEYGEPTPLQLVAAHRSALTPAVQGLREYLAHCFARMRAEKVPKRSPEHG